MWGILISPSALMKAKWPKRRNVRQSCIVIDLAHNIPYFVTISHDKPKVDDSSNNLKGEIRLSRDFLFHRIHSIWASEVRSMEVVVLFSVDIVRIISIGLLPCSFINKERMISIEHRPLSILHPKIAGKSLAQTINEIALNLGSDLKIIIAVDNVLIVCWEDSVVVGSSWDSKVEGLASVSEDIACSDQRKGKVSSWVFGESISLRNFEPLILGVG